MPKGIPLTEEELDRRRHEIFAKTVNLFIEKGFRETSMREIAEAAEMGKSSLYDYFKTKDEILLWAIEDEILDLTAAVQKIVAQPIPAIERLQQVMQRHLDLSVVEPIEIGFYRVAGCPGNLYSLCNGLISQSKSI